MPDEPNRNVEDQLKAWAQKRREQAGAPLELHPATRKMLQEEVARTYAVSVGQPAPQPSKPNWLALLWLRPAFVLPVVAAIAVMLALWAPSLTKSKSKGQAELQMAQQDKRGSLEELQRNETREKINEQVQLRREGTGAPAPSSSAAPTVPPPAQTPALAGERFYAADRSKDSLSVKLEASRDAAAEGDLRKTSEVADFLKAKEAPPLAQATPTTRGLAPDKEQTAVARQRHGLTQPQPVKDDENVGRRTLSLTSAQEAEAKLPAGQVAGGKTLAETRVALDVAKSGGFGGGALANKPGERRGVETVTLGAQAQPARAETANAFAYFSAVDAQATQRFAQAQNYRRNFNSPPMPNVLNSFQLAQNGRQITIVDADGSTYEGQIEGPQNEPVVRAQFADLNAADELRKRRTDAAARTQEWALQQVGANVAGQNVTFRVVGTNRTLNQLVVFLGNLLVADTNAPNAIGVNGVQAGVTLAPQSDAVPAQNTALQNRLQLQNARVQGQATIGDRNRIEINAVPTAP